MKQENFGFLDLLRYAWGYIWKYVVITVCTIPVYFIGELILGVPAEDFSGLLVTLAVTNCTGFLAEKLNRILRLLEVKESTDKT